MKRYLCHFYPYPLVTIDRTFNEHAKCIEKAQTNGSVCAVLSKGDWCVHIKDLKQ